MSWSSGAIPVLLLVLTTTPAVASPPPALGTADRPELSDQTGDVGYDPKYTGPRDRDFLDIDAAWIDYVETDDRFRITLRVVDGEGWTRIPTNSQVSCFATATSIVDGTEEGSLSVYANRFERTDEFEPSAARTRSGGQTEFATDLTFSMDMNRPGLMVWTIPRDWALWVGDSLSHWEAYCAEYDWTIPPTGAGISSPLYMNTDRGDAVADYSLVDAKPAAPEPMVDESVPISSQSSSPGFSDRTPTIGLLLSIVGMGLGVIASRRSRRRRT